MSDPYLDRLIRAFLAMRRRERDAGPPTPIDWAASGVAVLIQRSVVAGIRGQRRVH